MRKHVFDDRRAAPDMKRKFLPSAVVEDKTLGERQIRVVVSTPTPDRVKDVLEPSGVDVSAYRANPIVLADHNREAPIGTAEIEIKADRVEAVITFAPEGASAKADEYCALAKAGVLNTVSPGFIEKDASPMKGGGVHVKKWELLELSLVTVPCNAEATVIERKLPERAWRVGASLNLPLAPEGAKTAPVDVAALDAKTAHKGFLAYEAGASGKPWGYAIPFAHLVKGRLMVDEESIKGARAALALANFPEDVAIKAAAVLDHYEAKIGSKAPDQFRIKSLYEVSALANLLQELGWLTDWITYDDAEEGEPSAISVKLTDALRALGEALVQMTVEEVAELIGESVTTKDVALSRTKTANTLNLAMAHVRTKAGRAISKATADKIDAACKMIGEAHASLTGLIAEPESPAEDAGEIEEEKSAPDTGKAAPPLTQRERELAVLKLRKAL